MADYESICMRVGSVLGSAGVAIPQALELVLSHMTKHMTGLVSWQLLYITPPSLSLVFPYKETSRSGLSLTDELTSSGKPSAYVA